jgi:hypothetical protein
MSDADHRPRRIIAGPPLPIAQHLHDTATVLQQHRFQRVLLSSPGAHRRSVEARKDFMPIAFASPPAMPKPPARHPTDASIDTPPRHVAAREPSKDSERSATQGTTPAAVVSTRAATAPTGTAAATPAATSARTRRAQSTRATATRPAQVPDLPPRRDLLEDPQAWKHAGLAKPAPDDWDLDLAHRITRLCQKTSPSFQSWTVTVPLDATVLPDTELHMALSPQRLALRFQTLSPYSMALVTRHKDRLVALLSHAMPASREIDVELS